MSAAASDVPQFRNTRVTERVHVDGVVSSSEVGELAEVYSLPGDKYTGTGMGDAGSSLSRLACPLRGQIMNGFV